ncbi:MAG TPA: hypothetical protein VJK71_00320, partial [Gemmatimonadales bacterium]|nr:hypothetical protein [Gemmatimonadales bacterium]
MIGEYGPDSSTRVMILERDGALIARTDSSEEVRLSPAGRNAFRSPDRTLRFRTDARGRATSVALGDSLWPRRRLGDEDGFRIVPVRPVEDLRREALADSPPEEKGEFRPSELVELVRLDPTIKLDIRYATPGNFL